MQHKKPSSFSFEKVKTVLGILAEKDHLFASEAHLQTEFILEAKAQYPNYDYFPELVPYPIPEEFGDKDIHFDLIIRDRDSGDWTLIEFKYLTKEFSGETSNGMPISVKSHLATNRRRYACWSDIRRIELFADDPESRVVGGYFILVTNASVYWKPSTKAKAPVDIEFHINEGFHEAGTKRWQPKGSPDEETDETQRGDPIVIRDDYDFQYETFYEFKGRDGGLFRSLVVPITPRKNAVPNIDMQMEEMNHGK